MGVLLSKFRKEKTTAIILEQLEEKIIKLENYTLNTQEQKRRFVNNFLGISIGVYVVTFILLYFFYLPPTWNERIMYLVPLMLFPFIINFLRKLFAWYFQRKLNKNSDKLSALREEKTKILEQVMDKETYKVAVNLLERFSDKKVTRLSIGSQLMVPSKSNNNTPNTSINYRSSQQAQLRSRANTPHLMSSTPQRLNTTVPYQSVYRNNTQQASTQVTPANRTLAGQDLRRRTPFPIIDARNRSALDRIVDALVGDSPHDRFAMICKDCFAHNGMASKEDFNYTTFRCAFCNTLNPSRNARPVAPRLSVEQNPIDSGTPTSSSSSSSSPSSDNDDDEEDKGYVPPPSTATETEQNEATAALNETLEENSNTSENKAEDANEKQAVDMETKTLERLSQSKDNESNDMHAVTANALNAESNKE